METIRTIVVARDVALIRRHQAEHNRRAGLSGCSGACYAAAVLAVATRPLSTARVTMRVQAALPEQHLATSRNAIEAGLRVLERNGQAVRFADYGGPDGGRWTWWPAGRLAEPEGIEAVRSGCAAWWCLGPGYADHVAEAPAVATGPLSSGDPRRRLSGGR